MNWPNKYYPASSGFGLEEVSKNGFRPLIYALMGLGVLIFNYQIARLLNLSRRAVDYQTAVGPGC